MEFTYTSDLDELSMEEEENGRKNSHGKRKKSTCYNNDDDSNYKSKNLTAERKRRAKLNERLLKLRTSVPIITNMTKANIITDAITYIGELERHVNELTNELNELGKTYDHDEEEAIPVLRDENSARQEEINKWGSTEPEVKVVPIDGNKVWIKVAYEKKLGGLTKLVEAITSLGYELNDTNFTTSYGAAVVTSCLEGIRERSIDVEETKELLLSVISSI